MGHLGGNVHERKSCVAFHHREDAESSNSGYKRVQRPGFDAYSQQFPVMYQPVAVRLPTLELPTCTGYILGWPAFRDAFEARIDRNTQLSDVQKFLYS